MNDLSEPSGQKADLTGQKDLPLTGPGAGVNGNGATPTWSTSAIAAWLANHKGRSLGASTMLKEIAERLVKEGVPLDRANLALQDHHPQIAARAFRWRKEDGVMDSTLPLRNRDTSQEYRGSPIAAIIIHGADGMRLRLDRTEPGPDDFLARDLKSQGYTDYVAMPLIFSDGSRHFISWATRASGGFDTAQLVKLYDLLPLICMRFELDHSHLVTETLLNTYHGRRASERIRGGTIRRNQGERIAAILVYSDLRGFTRMTDRHTPEDVTTALGEYYEAVASPIEARGGDVIKMIGDGILSIFTYQDPMIGPCENTQACEAVAAVKEGYQNLLALSPEALPGSIEGLKAGFALHTGTVTFGNVGSSSRLDFTVIGPAVNEVVRVEELTKSLGRPILATSSFAGLDCAAGMSSLGFHALKGVREPQEVFALGDED